MTEVSTFRLSLLRAMYALMAIGLALTMWPRILDHRPEWPLMDGVVASMLGAIGLLAALGLRYPLKLLPVLLFELLWKTIWLLAVALPLWRSGRLDPDTMSTVRECAPVVLVYLVLPWRHLIDQYVRAPGDRWRASGSAAGAAAAQAKAAR